MSPKLEWFTSDLSYFTGNIIPGDELDRLQRFSDNQFKVRPVTLNNMKMVPKQHKGDLKLIFFRFLFISKHFKDYLSMDLT